MQACQYASLLVVDVVLAERLSLPIIADFHFSTFKRQVVLTNDFVRACFNQNYCLISNENVKKLSGFLSAIFFFFVFVGCVLPKALGLMAAYL